ncbi:ATP-binding protein [Neisseria sp. CCUG12390]|uniref:ATP-binding protein n=1 Tax=Neisseria sp. CCUG12390 TaxID=3392035 RepID=UPI003A10149C
MNKLETKITHSGVQNHFKNTEPEQAIIELAWNGFDAKAKNVDIILTRSELDALQAVTVLDDGTGIDIDNIQDNFGKFNDSSKKDNVEQHGSRGRGRLAFHKLANKADWYTKNKFGKQAKISINSIDLIQCPWIELQDTTQHLSLKNKNTGTCVELNEIFPKISIDNKQLIEKLSIEFGWFLALHDTHTLKLGSDIIKAPSHELFTHQILIDGHEFEVKLFLWDKKPTSEKSYIYLLNSYDKVVYKKLSSFNKKPDFYISIYIISKWADNFSTHDNDLLSEKPIYTPLSETWKRVESECAEFTRKIYNDFLKSIVEEKIAQFEKNGIFPDYKDILSIEQKEWRKENTKQLVRELYLADPKIFSNLNTKQQKIIIQLLDRLSISNENDGLIDIIENVLNLDQENTKKLAQQISKSKLEHIISTIEILQRRENVVHKLREIMNLHYKEVLETPDLQGIIENNTWLFGNAYETIGAEEDSFTKNAYSLRNKVPDIFRKVTQEDLDGENLDAEELEGIQRQVDLFLARKVPFVSPTGKKFFRCIIIEIKRPSIALNYTHLRQLDDYKRILQNHPEFSSENLHFELILIGRKISNSDTEIRGRINSLKNKLEPGLVTDDDRFKCYVKNWYSLLDEFDLINGYLLENLKTRRENLGNFSAKDLITDLHQESL